MDATFLALLLGLGTGNLIVTILLLRAPDYDRSQKAIQTLLVWLLPVIGAVLVWQFLRAERVPPEQENPFPEHRDAVGGYPRPDAATGRSSRREDTGGEGSPGD